MATTQRIRYDLEAAVSGEQDVAALARQLEGLADTLEGDLKVQAQASAQALRELGAKQGAIDNFVQLKSEAGDAADRLREAQLAAQKLGQAMAASGAPTRAQAGQMEKLRDAVRAAKTELQEETRALDNSRATLRAYGVSSDNVAKAERATRAAVAETRAEIQKLPAAMAAAKAAAESRAQAEKAAADAAVAAAKQREVAERAAAQAAVLSQRQAAIAAREAAREQAAAIKEVARQQADQAKATQAQLSGVGDTLRSIQTIALTAVGGTFLTSMARDVGAVADQYNNLRARMSLVTGDGPALEAAFESVRQVALKTSSDLESTVTLFARISQAGKELGISQQQALILTETIGKAIQVSGGSAESANAAITQLIQGLQSGVLRGEEFNSVMEQAPRLAQALAAGLGVTTGELRKMAQEGRLTSEVVLTALQGQAQAVAAEFDKLPPTIGRALQNLSTNWTVYIGNVDKATGASQAAANAINAVGENLDEIAAIATRAGAVFAAAIAVQAAGALRTYIAEATAASAATSLLKVQMSALPKTVQIAVAFVGFEAGFQIGDMLRANSELARKFGVAGGAVFEELSIKAIALKEVVAAIFTDDTVDQALARYETRLAQSMERTARMWDEAENGPKKAAAAATEAAAAIDEIGTAAQNSTKYLADLQSRIVEGVEANAVARRGDAQASEAMLRVQLQLAQQAEQTALYMGNEYQARQAQIEQKQIEIRIIEAQVAVQRVEAEGSIAVAQAKLAEMAASKDVNLVKQAELENTIKLAQAKLAEADATGKSIDLLRKQLESFKLGGSSADSFGGSLDRMSAKQRRFADETRGATQALREQAAAVADPRYSSPLGNDKYARAGSPSAYGNTREERLKGQSASDETLFYTLLDKLRSNTLTAEDIPALRSQISAIKTNQTIFDSLDPSASSLEARADDRRRAAARVQMEQALARLSAQDGGTANAGAAAVGRRVVLELRNADGTSSDVQTDEAGAQNLMRTLKRAGLSARG